MKKHLVILVIGAILILLIAGCGGAGSESQADPTTIVRDFYAAIKAEDLDLAMSYVADDAQFINPTGTYIGKDEVRNNLSALNEANLYFELRDLQNADGRVDYSYTTYIDGEAVEQGTDGVTIVKDGKVIFDGTDSTVPDSLK